MRSKLVRLHSPDVDDLQTYVPVQEDCFAFLLQIIVAPEGGAGEESFDAFVCTPRWLCENYAPSDVVIGSHKLIVFRYDYKSLHDFVVDRVNAASGDTWQQVARRLSSLGRWEFEDYVPAPSKG